MYGVCAGGIFAFGGTGVPHLWQNFESSGFILPHFEQYIEFSFSNRQKI
jgi:hypothetical protein